MKKFIYLFIIATCLFVFGIYSIAPRIVLGTNLPFYHIIKGKEKPKKISERNNFKLPFKTINIAGSQGNNIAANLIYTNEQQAKGTIIMLHGIRSSKEHFIPIANKVTAWGYNALLVDLKAHGESGGSFCTFGYYEKQDIADLITHIIETESKTTNFGIWGQSLGGAVALQALAVDERIEFGIIESTFAELRPTIHRYAKNYTGFNLPALTNFTIKRMESIANFKVDEVAPYKIAADINQPILLVHGAKDKRMPIASANKIFESLSNLNNQKYIIENANHLNVWQKGGEEYFSRVNSFLNHIENLQ